MTLKFINPIRNRFTYRLSFVLFLLMLPFISLLASNGNGDEDDEDQWMITVTALDHEFDSTKNSWWYGGQAKENYEQKDYLNAIVYFSYAIRIDSTISEFYYYRGNSYALTRQSENAFDDFKKALELNPDYLSALNNLGWQYFKSGEYVAAFKYFSNYIKLLPKRPKLLIGVGFNDGYLQLLNSLAWDALHSNNLPRAIRYFTNYIEIAPNNPNSYLGLALVYYKYLDFEQAKNYLSKAKVAEPALYKGYSGIVTIEKRGIVYTLEDKQLLADLFDEVSDKGDDFLTLTRSSFWRFLFAFTYLFLGIGALIIFIIRIKKFEGYILYLSILNFSFGIKFLYENSLFQLGGLTESLFWSVMTPLIDFIIPILIILFIRYFIGWGWKRSILYLLIFSIFQGVLQVVSEFSDPIPSFYANNNTIFGLIAVIVLLPHLFLPEMRKNREILIINGGFGFYLIAILYENMAKIGWLPDRLSFDETAYLVFNVCLLYIAFKRISNSEKELVGVKQDLETARNIQNAILPEINPKSEWYEMSSAYIPMALIGGDYYDYQQPDDSNIGVLVADVSGHGISAALIASMLKVAFSAQMGNAKHPAKLLEQINTNLAGQLNNEFITAGYFQIDLQNKKLIYSSAGHPPLVIFKRSTDKLTELKVEGIPIGVFPEVTFNESSVSLEKNDRLVLYTDGISDVFNPAGEAFGTERFINLIKETKNLDVEDTKQVILERLNTWSRKKEDETYEDDITLVIFDVL